MIDNKTIRQVVINKALLPCTPGVKVLKEISSQAGETGFNFYTNLDDAMPKFDITITPAQAAGTPTPDNPLPIEGDNELKISQGAETGSGLSEVYTIPLGQTVYGGVVDVVGGVVTETTGYKLLTGAESENWQNYTAGNGYYIQISDMASLNNGDGLYNLFPAYSGVNNLGIRLGFNNNFLYVYQANTIDGVSDIASWKTWLSTHNLQACYPLATPTTAQITPTEIKTFKKHTNKFRIRASYATEASYYTMEGGSCELAKQFLPIFYPIRKEDT